MVFSQRVRDQIVADFGLPAARIVTVPHGVGSVWATTLWDMHWAFVNGVPSLGIPGLGFRANLYDTSAPLAGNGAKPASARPISQRRLHKSSTPAKWS